MHTNDGADEVTAVTPRASDREICDSYLYLLGRLLVLRQERVELASGAAWNRLERRDRDGDVTSSEAWVAVDEYSATIIDVPKIEGRYFTIQISNLWGETLTNINERTFPDRPYGAFALCLKGANLTLPPDVRRIDLPGRKARVQIQIERRTDPKGATALRDKVAMRTTGTPVVADAIGIPDFTNEQLPGVEAFDLALAVLATEQDVNPGTDTLQAKVRVFAALARNPAERSRIDRVLRQASFQFEQALYVTDKQWIAQRLAGNYGTDWRARTAANLYGMWSNAKSELATFQICGVDGSHSYVMVFGRNDLPASHVNYFWSISCGDAFSLDSRSRLEFGHDGSLTLYFAPTLPRTAPAANWLQTPPRGDYTLTWRSYGPDAATIAGSWFPPQLQRVSIM
jgi:hypothetical protein